jgi:hypothetical protein
VTDLIYVCHLRAHGMTYSLRCGCRLERRDSGDVRLLCCAAHGQPILDDNDKVAVDLPARPIFDHRLEQP